MIGIVGNGFVGNAVHQNFKEKVSCKVFDVDENRSLNSLEEVLKQKFIFVCLPTPMKFTGECDTSILDSFFQNISNIVDGIFVIKSTVPIGTTKKYAKKFKVIHNPEFLTARNAVEDFKNSERNIVGGQTELCEKFVDFFESVFPHIPNIITSSDESETIKYFSNTFLSLKVAYFNKVYDLCQNLGMNYNNVCAGIISDSRIGKSHSKVPGIDGDRGFGGTCFPKDINSLIIQMESNGVDAEILKEVWKYNKKIRTVIDWTVT
ncbi:MAG: UDP-glucose/GDP-mannose dehydrogenase family protein [Flavobacteriales bacterium]|nr:UDP-glucose/GDP-mannose dehydrogenase family protein [Flavobacteriales bacterium]